MMTQDPSFSAFWVPLFLPFLLVFAVYRLTRLITKDDFPPVLWIRDRLAGGWRPLTGPEQSQLQGTPGKPLFITQEIRGIQNRWVVRASWSPHWLAELVTCPWCASGWVSGAVVLATDLTVGLPVPWLFGPAVWGAAALMSSQEWA